MGEVAKPVGFDGEGEAASPYKKAAAPGTVQRLVYNIKISQFFFAA
mgnify:CR=1 FL=1